jgi:hypothetical protein
MNSRHSFRLLTRAFMIAAFVSLAACGGGGAGSDAGVSFTGGVIGGTGIKGPVGNATVTAYAISGGAMGARIGTATTDASGGFSLPIGSYAGPVMLQLSGGTYTDEATGTTMPMASGDVMTAVLPTVAAGATITGVRMTPLTSMAQTLAQHLSGGMTDANIASANTAIGNYFMVGDILHVQPINPLVAGSATGASQESINYGMAMAAMTQYAKAQGMSSSSAIVTAMMNDASDTMMDGMMGSGSVMMGGMGMGAAMPANAGTSGLASALSTFTSSTQNKSSASATTMQPLANKLATSNGQLMGSASTPAAKSIVSGTVFNGTMQLATVTAFAVANGTRGAQLASTTTDAQGSFTMSMGTYSGPVMLQASVGTYIDEATGAVMKMGSGDVMTALMTTVASGANAAGVMITPLTSMAQARAQAMSGGMMDANIAAANAAVGGYCMVGDVLKTMPMNTLATGSAATARQDAKNYGACIAAMSQYAKGLGMPVSSAFITDMMDDAADGMMNGRMGGSSITMPMGGMMGGQQNMMQANAGTSGLADAMAAFMGSAMNLSGATTADVAALMQRLMSSTGQLQ